MFFIFILFLFYSNHPLETILNKNIDTSYLAPQSSLSKFINNEDLRTTKDGKFQYPQKVARPGLESVESWDSNLTVTLSEEEKNQIDIIRKLIVEVSKFFLGNRSGSELDEEIKNWGIYQASSSWSIPLMFKYIAQKEGRRNLASWTMIDLGSGMGHVCFWGYIFRLKSLGVDLSNRAIELSQLILNRLRSIFPTITDFIQFKRGNFLDEKISQYDIVYYYTLGSHHPDEIEQMVLDQLKPGAYFIVNGVSTDVFYKTERFNRLRNSSDFEVEEHDQLHMTIYTRKTNPIDQIIIAA